MLIYTLDEIHIVHAIKVKKYSTSFLNFNILLDKTIVEAFLYFSYQKFGQIILQIQIVQMLL